jgi:hypothetical protein
MGITLLYHMPGGCARSLGGKPAHPATDTRKNMCVHTRRNGLLRDTYPRVRYAESKETVAALPDTAHGGKEGAKYLWQILHGIFEVYVSRRV